MHDSISRIVSAMSRIKSELNNLEKKNEETIYLRYVSEHGEEWVRFAQEVQEGSVRETVELIEQSIHDTVSSEHLYRLFAYSFLLHVTTDGKYADKLCKEVNDPYFSKHNRLFLYNQLKRFYFTHVGASGTPALQKLYESIVEEWRSELKDTLKPLPASEREKNRIVVVTLQFLGATHAPTKTALERIYTIGKLMGKEVICVNSKEQYTLRGIIPLCDITARSVIKEYDGVHIMEHGDYSFPLIQPEVEMPDEEMTKMLLEEIRNMAPWMVVVCGDKCLLGDLCEDMIPTISIPMVFSTIPKKKRGYVAIGKTITESEKEKLRANGYDTDTIIESVFTFELIKQTTTLTREMLNLPCDKFLLGLIGIRLAADISADFLQLLLTCKDAGIHLVFAGKFETYDQLCETVEGLRDNSSFIGYQKDILALWDVLDLYVNPPRVGGGFSVAEAFCKGKPGISMNWGDVAASAGPEFCVDSLEEYPALIRRYITDQAFYKEMSEKAVARSKRLFDSKGEMEKILQEAEKRRLWF